MNKRDYVRSLADLFQSRSEYMASAYEAVDDDVINSFPDELYKEMTFYTGRPTEWGRVLEWSDYYSGCEIGKELEKLGYEDFIEAERFLKSQPSMLIFDILAEGKDGFIPPYWTAKHVSRTLIADLLYPDPRSPNNPISRIGYLILRAYAHFARIK